MKAYKLELLIVDHDRLGPKEIITVLENQKYPNYCIAPRVMKIDERDVGAWDDDHPLNLHSSLQAEYDRLFASKAFELLKRLVGNTTLHETEIALEEAKAFVKDNPRG